MDLSTISTELRRRFEDFAATVGRPPSCPRCEVVRPAWRNGYRIRSASFWYEGRVVYLAELRVRLAKCPSCRWSWTLYPPGLLPCRHYQASLVFEAIGSWLLEEGASEEVVAERADCSRRTVGRWLRWLSSVAQPAELVLSLVELTGEVILPSVSRIAPRRTQLEGGSRGVFLELVAEVLSSLAALAAFVGNRVEIILGIARRHRDLLWGMLPM